MPHAYLGYIIQPEMVFAAYGITVKKDEIRLEDRYDQFTGEKLKVEVVTRKAGNYLVDADFSCPDQLYKRTPFIHHLAKKIGCGYAAVDYDHAFVFYPDRPYQGGYLIRLSEITDSVEALTQLALDIEGKSKLKLGASLPTFVAIK